MAQPEKYIENEILRALKQMGIFHFKVKTTASYDPKMGGFRRISPLYRKGVADIIGIFKGKPLAIEVKTKTGRLRPDQVIFLREFEEAGGITIVARSVEDVLEGFKKYVAK